MGPAPFISTAASVSTAASERPVVVIGAGVSGLTVAYRLAQKNVPVVCLEAASHPGGNIQTARHDGYVYDLGPDSFLKTKPEAADLCRELGLGEELIAPRPGASLVHVAHDGALYPMPEGLSLGVPRRPGPLLVTELLSGPAKLRALMEPFIRRPARVGEESIFEFLSRRLGAEMAERLAAPLLSGVFAGDARALSMDAAFPQLIALEKRYGSLFSGMNGGKSILQVLREPVPTPESPFVTLSGGLGALIDALVRSLPPRALRLRTRAERVIPSEDGQRARIVCEDGALEAVHVVVAGPPWAALPLLGPLDRELESALARVRGFATATVFFALDARHVHHDFVGSGFIVPPGEAEILAGTFVSSKWEGRSPEGKILVRAFLGGGRCDISSWDDTRLTEVAARELERLLGTLGPPDFTRVHRYARGTPQPEIGHEQLLARIFSKVAERPWLSLTGSGYGGVGIPDCVRQANEVAAKVAARVA